MNGIIALAISIIIIILIGVLINKIEIVRNKKYIKDKLENYDKD